MKTKTDKPKTTDKNEERFYQFAKALMAVPKKEIDADTAKHDRQKSETRSKNRPKR